MIRRLAVLAAALGTMTVSDAQTPPVPPTDYSAVAAAISKTMRARHYNPAELELPGYKRVEAAVADMAATATSDGAFVDGFRAAWREGPFSHVELRPAQQSADEIAAYLDGLRIGGGGAALTWAGDIAVLTVNTMMGLDTIEEIDAAYDMIAEKGAAALIIDLRQNGGGAFAVRPLTAHLLAEPFDAGSFVSQRWSRDHDRAPTLKELRSVDPWKGWSIRAFWADVQEQALVRLTITPAEPHYAGPAFVLTSRRTASAAELAADILKSSGRATLIGETTAGEMLSQKIFDVPGGFQLSLPIADYYSATHGRIEGVGVEPDIESAADAALEIALRQ